MLHQLPILYVEDSDADFLALKSALKHTAHAGGVLRAVDAEDALRCLTKIKSERSQIGLILVDLVLPGTGGIELIRAFRAENLFRSPPIIAITGQYSFAQVEASYAAGANLSLIKPNDLNGWSELAFHLLDYFSASH